MALVSMKTGKEITLRKGYDEERKERQAGGGGTDSRGGALRRLGMTETAPDVSGEAWTRAAPSQTRIPESRQTASRDWNTFGVTGAERREKNRDLERRTPPKRTPKGSMGSDDAERALQNRYNQALTYGDMDTVREIDRFRKGQEPAEPQRDWAYGLTGTERRERQESAARQLEELEKQRMDTYRNGLFDPEAATRIAKQEKTLRASVGKQTFGDRLESGLSAVFHPVVATEANKIGLVADTALEAVRRIDGPGDREVTRQWIERYQNALTTGRTWDGTAVTPEMRAQFQEALRDLYREYGETEEPVPFEERHTVLSPALTNARDEAYRVADQSRAAGAQAQEEARAGLGKYGRLAVDLGIAAGQLGVDAAIGSAFGIGTLLPMSFRSGSLAAQEARRDGATIGEQLVYGAGNAAIAAGTSWGAGKLKNWIRREEALKPLVQTYIREVGLAGAAGGLEGGVRAGLQSAWKKTYDPDAEIDWLSVLYNAAIDGVLEGVIGGGKMAARWMARNGNRKSGGGETDLLDIRDQNHVLGNPGDVVPYYAPGPNMSHRENAPDTGKGIEWGGHPTDDLSSVFMQNVFGLDTQWGYNSKTGWQGRSENGNFFFRHRNHGNFER